MHFDDRLNKKDDLVRYLKENTGVLRNKEIEEAFRQIDRKDFILSDHEAEAYEDHPLPIGYGQTISQPTTVAFMLELLDLKEGYNVLDIGSGSGWTTALLAHIVGAKGKVLGLEIVPELVLFGQQNLRKYDLPNARIEFAEDENKKKKEAPFDRILVSASADKFPEDLLVLLKEEGVIVIPVKDTLHRLVKKKEGGVEKEKFPGFVFVPLK